MMYYSDDSDSDLEDGVGEISADRVARNLGIKWIPIPRNVLSSPARNFQANLLRAAGQLMRGVGDYDEEEMRVKVGFEAFSGSDCFETRPTAAPFRYHDVFLPSWEAFAKALRGCACEYEYSLAFQNIEMPQVILELLASALEGKRLGTLKLENVGLEREGLRYTATRIIEANSQNLHKVHLTRCNLGLKENWDLLAVVIGATRDVQFVGLSDNKIGPEIVKMIVGQTACKEGESQLRLTDNDIGDEGAEYIASELKKNPNLTIIELWGNHIKDKGIIALAQALASNTKLKELYLETGFDEGIRPLTYEGKNEITEAGEKALQDAVFDLTSLESISKSNHTCELYYNPCGQLVNGGLNGVDAKISVQLKIRHTLGTIGDCRLSVQYLSDIPLGIMPRLLQFVQSQVPAISNEYRQRMIRPEYGAGKTLSQDVLLKNVYEVVRSCVVPQVFDPQEKQKGLKRKQEVV